VLTSSARDPANGNNPLAEIIIAGRIYAVVAYSFQLFGAGGPGWAEPGDARWRGRLMDFGGGVARARVL